MSVMLLAIFEGAIQLVPDGTLLVHILLILLMVGLLNRTLFQPIAVILRERESRGGGALAEAAEIHRRVKALTDEFENALRSARSSKYRSIEDQRTEGLRERNEKLELIRQELEAAREKEKAEIESQADVARNALLNDAMSIATDIRNQILKPVDSRRLG